MRLDVIKEHRTDHLSDQDHSHNHFEDENEMEFAECKPKPAIVYDLLDLSEDVPEGFDAVCITLDGSVKSDLFWKKELECADKFISQGLKIFWYLDLGLFKDLKHPLDNQTQFLTLSLSIDHFRDTVWKNYKEDTIGLCIFRGSIRFERALKWNEKQFENLQGWLKDFFENGNELASETEMDVFSFKEITPELLKTTTGGERLLALFCRDTAGEYLELLSSSLPDTLRCFALMNAEMSKDSLLTAQLLTKERYPKITLGVKGGGSLAVEFGFDDSVGPLGYISRSIIQGYDKDNYEMPTHGICLPLMSKCKKSDVAGLDVAIEKIKTQNGFYRAIPESMLTALWDGLDVLYVSKGHVSSEGKRKLQGFLAAGGTII